MWMPDIYPVDASAIQYLDILKEEKMHFLSEVQ